MLGERLYKDNQERLKVEKYALVLNTTINSSRIYLYNVSYFPVYLDMVITSICDNFIFYLDYQHDLLDLHWGKEENF